MQLKNQRFLYQDVADELRKRISSGRYPEGTAIPSLAELVSSFGVSLITIRRALQQLMFEGVLYGRQGLGVFVSDTRPIVRILTASVDLSLGDQIKRAGFAPRIAEVACELVLPDEDIKKRLRLRGDTTVYRHEKVVFADDVAIAIDLVHIPCRLYDLLSQQLAGEFVFALLNKLGIMVSNILYKFSSALSTEEQAKLLGVAPRFPLITAHYVLFDQNGNPMLEGSTSSRADRMTFEVATSPQMQRAQATKTTAHNRRKRRSRPRHN